MAQQGLPPHGEHKAHGLEPGVVRHLPFRRGSTVATVACPRQPPTLLAGPGRLPSLTAFYILGHSPTT